jgi:DNA helicase-2/ATP-dependent DNA helicase PcrA
MFVRDLATARVKIKESGIFLPDDIVDEAALELD